MTWIICDPDRRRLCVSFVVYSETPFVLAQSNAEFVGEDSDHVLHADLVSADEHVVVLALANGWRLRRSSRLLPVHCTTTARAAWW